ncbi:transposase [Streptomyces sp. S1A(2023)]
MPPDRADACGARGGSHRRRIAGAVRSRPRPGPRPRPGNAAQGDRGGILPQHLHELQAQNRANQQESPWRRLYATRSGVEGTIREFINGHQARRSRYHGHRKTHVQHVLTGIAINIERLASRTTRRPRRPTAFQQYLDARGLTWECWWRQGK